MNKKKKLRLIIIFGIIVFVIAFYQFMNRGIKREISNHIAVGADLEIPSKKGTIRASYFNESGLDKSPAVIVVTGSGDSTFRESWEPGDNGFWKPLTNLFVNNGYAVLLLEKRGINGSKGHWEHQSFEDRAEDVKDAIDYLRTRDDINKGRIGLVGHSQGGWVVQLASVIYKDDVSFIVNLAGPSGSVINQTLDENEGRLIIGGNSNDEIQKKIGSLRNKFNIIKMLSPIIKLGSISNYINYDSEYVRTSISVPVFSVYAENDRLILPLKNKILMEDGLKTAGNQIYQIHIIPGVNHRYLPAEFGTPNEELSNVKISDEFMDVMEKFIYWEQGGYR
jgi:pimeloyl-ACP methyl ester carboxylesterase